MFFTEFCDARGYDYFDPVARELWERHEREQSVPCPPVKFGGARLGDLKRTWKNNRADELRRRGYGVRLRIVFPRQPLRIVRCILDQ